MNDLFDWVDIEGCNFQILKKTSTFNINFNFIPSSVPEKKFLALKNTNGQQNYPITVNFFVFEVRSPKNDKTISIFTWTGEKGSLGV